MSVDVDGFRTHEWRRRFLAYLLLGIVLAAWSLPAGGARAEDGLASADTTVAPEPEPTEPGGSEPNDDGAEEGLGTAGIVLIVAVAAVVLLVFMAGRGSARPSTVTVTSSPPPPPPAAGPTHRERLRSVYTQGRTILDRFDGREVERRRSAPRHLADETRTELQRTLSDIYELETEATTSSERSVLRSLAESINELDRSVDGVVAGGDAASLDEARARLDRSLENFADHIGRT